MGERVKPGDKLPFFAYDTPFEQGCRFRELLEVEAPLVMVFMSNFGHPVTRTFLQRYAATAHLMESCGLAVVVRSRPEKLAAGLPDGLPFELLCDAEGVLYEYLQIPQKKGLLSTASLEAWGILRRAKKRGYRPDKNAMQQLPLTLILDADGTILFARYGQSLTDVPADSGTIEQLVRSVLNLPEPTEEEAGEFEDAVEEEAIESAGESFEEWDEPQELPETAHEETDAEPYEEYEDYEYAPGDETAGEPVPGESHEDGEKTGEITFDDIFNGLDLNEMIRSQRKQPEVYT